MQQVNEFRLALLKRQVELESRVAAIETDVKYSVEIAGNDWKDQAQSAENDEVLSALHQQAGAELHEVEKALNRIEHHCYTRCAECGGQIELERLRALPYTELCSECMQGLEDAL
jgi:RNA polymerase-binding transcription factor DksA